MHIYQLSNSKTLKSVYNFEFCREFTKCPARFPDFISLNVLWGYIKFMVLKENVQNEIKVTHTETLKDVCSEF
jgi:hypothetical protein